MLYRVIDAGELPALVSAFMETYEVVAPVKRGRSYAFQAIESFDEIELDYPTTIVSPKKYFLPPKETLLEFDACGNQVTDFAAEITPRVIFGAHACDINALNRLDLVFKDGRYPDPYYVARRGATLVVGVSCLPTETCFCHLWGSDEARYGYDLFLQDIGGKYLVSISSVEAANILEAACDPRVATDEDRIEFRHATRRRQAAFNPDIPDIQEVAMLTDAFHKDPFWDELGERCLSCTACSAVCPPASASTSRTCATLTARPGGASACRTPARRPSSRSWRAATTSVPTGEAACATACTTSSTAFWPTTTGCSAWDAGAA